MKRSRFDLSHERKMTMKVNGTLYPLLCEAVIPGDKFRVSSEILARVTPLINPIYHRFDITTHYFYVPNRLIWENWTKFMFPETVDSNGDEQELPVFPNFSVGNNLTLQVPYTMVKENTLADYLGCAIDGSKVPSSDSVLRLSSLPFRAYQLIYNEWYRDQDLGVKVPITTGDGFTGDDADMNMFILRKRCWEKDYFTSARPWPQKGRPATVNTASEYNEQAFAKLIDDEGAQFGIRVGTDGKLTIGSTQPTEKGISIDANTNFTVEDFRYANAVQKFLEKLSRHGSRYVEAIQSFFGVRVPDFRLQRPEYLGGGRQPLVISEVLQTAQSEDSPLGTYGGHGISSGKAQFSYMFPEHGYVIGLISIMPRAGYMHTIRKDFFKSDRFDFFWPEFAHLGEQEIIRAEIQGTLRPADTPEGVFGYQERYAEYRFIPSTTHGLFRTDVNLRNFHADRAFDEYVLNADFVQVMNSDDIERIFALDAVNYDPILVDVVNNIDAIRPIPMFQKPNLG